MDKHVHAVSLSYLGGFSQEMEVQDHVSQYDITNLIGHYGDIRKSVQSEDNASYPHAELALAV